MQSNAPKAGKEMPMWARIIAAVIGIILVLMSLVGFFALGPLKLQIVLVLLATDCMGVDLLFAAAYNRWPLAFFWL